MSKTFTIKNPATGAVIGTYAQQDPAILPGAVAKAREAQHTWKALTYKQRASHIMKMKAFLTKNVDRVAKCVSEATGKTLQDAICTEALTGVLSCDWYARNTASALASQKLSAGSPLFMNKSNTLYYEPVGVVGIISPWNYPFAIPFAEVIMGLMAGNAILLKVASNTTSVGVLIEEVVNAGELPEGLFQHVVLPGAEAGPALLAAGINKLFFTGSVRVGKELMAEAAKTLTPVCLELGGNDPMLVLEDACVERAVNCALWAGFSNAGQSCGGVERIYVHESLYEEFLAQLSHKTRCLRHGPDTGNFGVDIGSMTTKSQYETVDAQVREAVSKGAKIVAQSRPIKDCPQGGLFYPATVMVGCTEDMLIIKEETFGPILPVMSYTDEEEAIRLANNCSLALTSSVFSKNKKHAMNVAHRLESGVVTVNDHLYTNGMVESPWGGWKESGLGRTHGYLGLKEMTNVKCINTDLLSSSLAPRNLWWYPYSEQSYNLLRSAVDFVAPSSCGAWLNSVVAILTKSTYMFKKWKPVEDTGKPS